MSESISTGTLKKSDLSSSEMPLCESVYPEREDDDIMTIKTLKTLKENGDKMLMSEQLQDAYNIYAQALPLIYQKTTPPSIENEEILINLAKCSLGLKKLSECKGYCYDLINTNNTSPLAHHYLGLAYKEEGNQEKSEKYLQLAYQFAQLNGIFYPEIIELKKEEISLTDSLGIKLMGSFVLSYGSTKYLLKCKDNSAYIYGILANFISIFWFLSVKQRKYRYSLLGTYLGCLLVYQKLKL